MGSKRFTIALRTTGQQQRRQQSTRRQPTTAQQPTKLIKNDNTTKWGRGGGGGTKDIAKPGCSTTGVANRAKTVRLVVRAKQMGFDGLLEKEWWNYDVVVMETLTFQYSPRIGSLR